MSDEERAEARVDDGREQVAEAIEAAPDMTEVLAQLQEENGQLQQRLEELDESTAERESLGERLAEAEEANEQLRRYASVALDEALRKAADVVGVAPEAAGLQAHRFRCEVDAGGNVTVEPNPTEFLLREMKRNPLLARSAERRRADRTATAAIHSPDRADDADPVELLSWLGRNPARKARFIARHGTEGYLALAARRG